MEILYVLLLYIYSFSYLRIKVHTNIYLFYKT